MKKIDDILLIGDKRYPAASEWESGSWNEFGIANPYLRAIRYLPLAKNEYGNPVPIWPGDDVAFLQGMNDVRSTTTFRPALLLEYKRLVQMLLHSGCIDITEDVGDSNIVGATEYDYASEVETYLEENSYGDWPSNGSYKTFLLKMCEYKQYIQCGPFIFCFLYAAWDYLLYVAPKKDSNFEWVSDIFGARGFYSNKPSFRDASPTIAPGTGVHVPKVIYQNVNEIITRSGFWLIDITGKIYETSVSRVLPYEKIAQQDGLTYLTAKCVKTNLTWSWASPVLHSDGSKNVTVIAKNAQHDKHYILVLQPLDKKYRTGLNGSQTLYMDDYVPDAWYINEDTGYSLSFSSIYPDRDVTNFFRSPEIFDIVNGEYARRTSTVTHSDAGTIGYGYSFPRKGYEYYKKNFGMAVPLTLYIDQVENGKCIIFDELYLSRFMLSDYDWFHDFVNDFSGLTIDCGKFFYLCGTRQGTGMDYGDDIDGGASVTRRNLLLKTEDFKEKKVYSYSEANWLSTMTDEEIAFISDFLSWYLSEDKTLPLNWLKMKIVVLFDTGNGVLNAFKVLYHSDEVGLYTIIGWYDNVEYCAEFDCTLTPTFIKAKKTQFSTIDTDRFLILTPWYSINSGQYITLSLSPYLSNANELYTGVVIRLDFYRRNYIREGRWVDDGIIGHITLQLPSLNEADGATTKVPLNGKNVIEYDGITLRMQDDDYIYIRNTTVDGKKLFYVSYVYMYAPEYYYGDGSGSNLSDEYRISGIKRDTGVITNVEEFDISENITWNLYYIKTPEKT